MYVEFRIRTYLKFDPSRTKTRGKTSPLWLQRDTEEPSYTVKLRNKIPRP